MNTIRNKSKNTDPPPEWLKPYMGETWQPWTFAQWYDVLVKERLIKVARSSAAERIAHNDRVVGSTPTGPK
jgi:hypothetical protein